MVTSGTTAGSGAGVDSVDWSFDIDFRDLFLGGDRSVELSIFPPAFFPISAFVPATAAACSLESGVFDLDSDPACASLAAFAFPRRLRLLALGSCALPGVAVVDGEGASLATGVEAFSTRFGPSGLGRAGLYRSANFSAAIGRPVLKGEGACAGDGV